MTVEGDDKTSGAKEAPPGADSEGAAAPEVPAPTVAKEAQDAGGDYRQVLKKRLAEKRSQLGATEESIKKYAPPFQPSEQNAAAPGQRGDPAGRGSGGIARFQSRLGPPGGGGGGRGLGSRLGPPRSEMGRGGGAEEDFPRRPGGGLLSRVVVDQKSRDEVMAENRQVENEQVAKRNKRMFGNLLGTLARFRQDENRVREREQKKAEVEKKVEERTEREREDARKQKRELFVEKRRQEHELKVLQLQMKRVEEFEVWERAKKAQMNFIRTSGDGGATRVYFAPKVHNDATLGLVEETMEAAEAEIKEARDRFEEELLKIEAKVGRQDPDHEDEEEEEDSAKPRSVVVSRALPHRRRRSSGHDGGGPPPPEAKRRRESDSPGRGRQERPPRDGGREEAEKKPARRVVEVKKEEEGSAPKRKVEVKREPGSPKSKRARRESSSSDSSESSSGSSDSGDSGSDDSSSDEEESGKREVKKEIKKEKE